MIGLKDLEFEEYYFSPQDDIVSSFFIPALKKTERYDRATGFFTSSSLVELSVGVCDLAIRGGKIRIITSPRLTSEDVIAIKEGYDLLEKAGESMVKNFDMPKDLASLDRLALLSELVSMGVLEIKIAVMKNLEQYPYAMFHTKFGLMHDSSEGKIAFTGSMNETQNGLGGNWDHIAVSTADPSNKIRISKLEERFEKLWAGQDECVETFDLPKVAQDLIDRCRSDRSMLNIDKQLLEKYGVNKDLESVYFKSPTWLEQSIRQYQEDAIEKWVMNGYRGVFNMATGTGKTKTALRALERLYNAKPNEGIFTIIIAPQKHLVDQWAEEIKNFDVLPIIGHSDSSMGSWKDRFGRQMMIYRSNPRNSCLVTTISSFASKGIQEWLPRIENLAIVVDEAHNMGSDNRLLKLPETAKYRLALSATMDRYKDASGTARLRGYFGEECINFPLEAAIGKFLSNYNYYPIMCHYNGSEYAQLVDSNEYLDSILKSNVSNKEKMKAKNEYLEYSYTINAKMDSKFSNLEKLMENYVGKDHFLVYSGKVKTDDLGEFDDSSHTEFLNAIDKTARILGMNGLGMKISRITYKESASERKRIIEEFDRGDTEGIIAISCLDEGVDIPSIQTAVIMSSSDNPREYIQRRGRVLRQHSGKESADIYDFIVVPKALHEVDPRSAHVGIELKMLAKEIRRMKEFAKPALNYDHTEKLFREISVAYGITIDEIIEVYGEEYHE